jgi:hypothetical protein
VAITWSLAQPAAIRDLIVMTTGQTIPAGARGRREVDTLWRDTPSPAAGSADGAESTPAMVLLSLSRVYM